MEQSLRNNMPYEANQNNPNVNNATNMIYTLTDPSAAVIASSQVNIGDPNHQYLEGKVNNPNHEYWKTIPSGYRFCPTDEELITYYLSRKAKNEALPPNLIVEVDIYKYSPEVLAEEYMDWGEQKLYFFTSRDRRYRNGSRPKRSAGDGFWKATGSDKEIFHEGKVIGYKRTLVFYHKRPSKKEENKKTNWIMHEYRLNEPPHSPRRRRCDQFNMRLDDCILCRIYKKAEKPKETPVPHQEKGNVQHIEVASKSTGAVTDVISVAAATGAAVVGAASSSMCSISSAAGAATMSSTIGAPAVGTASFVMSSAMDAATTSSTMDAAMSSAMGAATMSSTMDAANSPMGATSFAMSSAIGAATTSSIIDAAYSDMITAMGAASFDMTTAMGAASFAMSSAMGAATISSTMDAANFDMSSAMGAASFDMSSAMGAATTSSTVDAANSAMGAASFAMSSAMGAATTRSFMDAACFDMSSATGAACFDMSSATGAASFDMSSAMGAAITSSTMDAANSAIMNSTMGAVTTSSTMDVAMGSAIGIEPYLQNIYVNQPFRSQMPMPSQACQPFRPQMPMPTFHQFAASILGHNIQPPTRYLSHPRALNRNPVNISPNFGTMDYWSGVPHSENVGLPQSNEDLYNLYNSVRRVPNSDNVGLPQSNEDLYALYNSVSSLDLRQVEPWADTPDPK